MPAPCVDVLFPRCFPTKERECFPVLPCKLVLGPWHFPNVTILTLPETGFVLIWILLSQWHFFFVFFVRYRGELLLTEQLLGRHWLALLGPAVSFCVCVCVWWTSVPVFVCSWLSYSGIVQRSPLSPYSTFFLFLCHRVLCFFCTRIPFFCECTYDHHTLGHHFVAVGRTPFRQMSLQRTGLLARVCTTCVDTDVCLKLRVLRSITDANS
jgi:hypothetical protein